MCTCSIGDHFLTTCVFLDNERRELFSAVGLSCKNFLSLDYQNKAQFVLTAGGAEVEAVAKFCHYGFEKSNEHLSDSMLCTVVSKLFQAV